MRRSRFAETRNMAGIGRATRVERTVRGMAQDEGLRDELLAMLANRDPDALRARAERLWEILDDYEVWPGRRLVGDDRSRAGGLIAQFAIEPPGLQRRCLERPEVAVAYGDAHPA